MKKNVVCIRLQKNIRRCVHRASLIVAATLALTSCRPQLVYKYNGARIYLPKEIDCAWEGDTLIVAKTKWLGKNRREIHVAPILDSVAVSKRSTIKN